MDEKHYCDKTLDYVSIYKSDSGWMLGVFDGCLRGFEERVFLGVTLRIPIDCCPCCGANLEEEEESDD